MKKINKKITIFITHSLGELDVLFPLLFAIKDEYAVDIEMVFCVEKIYQDYLSNAFYLFCSEKISISVSYIQLPNKIDSKFRKSNSNLLERITLKLYINLLIARKSYYLLKKIIYSNLVMHEITNVYSATKQIYWVNAWNEKKIFTYRHGHSIDVSTTALRKIKFSNRVTLLNFHKHSEHYARTLGFDNQFFIGYPKFFKTWISTVSRYSKNQYSKDDRKCVVIYTRGVHEYYMDKDKYEFLLVSSYKTVRSILGDVEIIVKPHPRECSSFINQIIDRVSGKNIHISSEHSAVIASNAILAISFWTSAILDSLSLGVPSVEYYIEAEKFREIEPNGSSYKNMGVDSVSNPDSLKLFINNVVLGKYKTPNLIKDLSGHKDISFMDLV